MPKPERIFNNRERKVFRKNIPKGEALFGAVFVAFVAMMTAWFALQKDNYDPDERDITMDLMIDGSVEDNLYRTPLERWVDPSKAPVGGGAPVLELGIFPQTLLDGGWEPASRLQEFDADTLYEKINGAAPQYIQFGFQRLHFIAISKGEEEINIELYDMGAFPNAMGIFAGQRNATAQIDAYDQARYYNTEIGAIGIAGPYYFKITGSTSDAVITEKAAQLVEMFGRMPAGDAGLPKIYRVFSETFEVPFDGIVYEKSDVFQYAFANDFWFAADPQVEGQRYFYHESASEEDAKTLVGLLVENLLFDYNEVSRSDTGVVLKHQFLDEYFTVQMQGAAVYGIDAAPGEDALDLALQRLEAAFFNAEA